MGVSSLSGLCGQLFYKADIIICICATSSISYQTVGLNRSFKQHYNFRCKELKGESGSEISTYVCWCGPEEQKMSRKMIHEL